MRFRMLLLPVLLASGAFVPRAEALAIKCSGCSPQQYRQAAIGAGQGNHVVYDFLNRRVVGFEVLREPGAPLQVTVQPVPGEVLTMVGALSDVYAETGGTMRKSVEVTHRALRDSGLGGTSDATNAYDVLRDNVVRTRIGDHLAQVGVPVGSASEAWGTIIEFAGEIFGANQGLLDGVELTVVITFEDGSRVAFRITPGEPHAEYVIGSARNANGDPLVERNERDYAGTYPVGNPLALQQFLLQLQILGISHSGSVSGASSVTCTWNGHTLHCFLRPY